MNVIITMGGLGSRFRKAGYNIPKYQIEVNGRTLFEWSMMSLEEFKQNKFTFLVRREDDSKDFIERECKRLDINRYKILELNHLTRGQAETASLAIPYCKADEAVLIYNIDTYVERGQITEKAINGDGFIPCFNAKGDHWSFVKLNEKGNAIEVREKNRISDYCTIGAYYFCSAEIYEKIYNELYIKQGYSENGEQYIAPMYNWMIKHGLEVRIQNIEPQYVHVLGTPEEVKRFENYKRSYNE